MYYCIIVLLYHFVWMRKTNRLSSTPLLTPPAKGGPNPASQRTAGPRPPGSCPANPRRRSCASARPPPARRPVHYSTFRIVKFSAAGSGRRYFGCILLLLLASSRAASLRGGHAPHVLPPPRGSFAPFRFRPLPEGIIEGGLRRGLRRRVRGRAQGRGRESEGRTCNVRREATRSPPPPMPAAAAAPPEKRRN